MQCIVVQTSPERIEARPVTNEAGAPHVYATIAEARAELRANGYSYSRANNRYYIKGTEYRAYVLRADSEEYAEIMEQAAEQAAPEYIEPEHIQTVSGNKIYRSVDPVTGCVVFTVAGRDFWELAEARYFAQCNPVTNADQETAHAASIAAATLVDAYAAAEGITPADVTAEQHAAAYTVAAADVIGTDKDATAEERATVAAMVEAIATRWMQDHQPEPEPEPAPTYQRHELEAFLGDCVDGYDVDAIEAEATTYAPRTGLTVWTAEALEDLAGICERHEIAAYMRRHGFGDYSRADAATREEMEDAALEFAAREQTRPGIWQEAGERQARARYGAGTATARDLMSLQAAGAITAEDAQSYRAAHGWTPRRH